MKKVILIIIIILVILALGYILLKSFVFPKEGEKYRPNIVVKHFFRGGPGSFRGFIGNFIDDHSCGWGLRPIIGAIEHEDGSCAFPLCECYVCTKCGDGVCKDPENGCSCPIDCRE